MNAPIDLKRLDEMEQRAQLAESVELPVDDFLALVSAAKNGLKPQLVSTTPVTVTVIDEEETHDVPFAVASEIVWLRNRLEDRDEEVVRLLEDKDRLDYLDRLNATLNGRYGSKYGWRLIFNHNVARLFLGDQMAVDLADSHANGLKSCRDAIDEKMSVSEREKS